MASPPTASPPADERHTDLWSWLALAPSLVLVVVALAGPIASGDLWWHLRTGQWILDHGALPDTDPGVDAETGQALAAWNDAVPGHAIEGVPVAVLVDRSTASASEILAGSLRQRAGARLFGESTVGKGRSQRHLGSSSCCTMMALCASSARSRAISA